MRFAILGSPEAVSGGRRLALGGPQQRALFALLVLEANHVISAERLVDDLWDGESPAAARRLLQGCVVRLRRSLRDAAEPGRQPLVTRSPGYLLELRPGELDVEVFDRLVEAADGRIREGTAAGLEAAAAQLREALALWRGPALDGITIAACEAHARRLDERREAAVEARVDVDLCLGRHAELVGELQGYTQAHPLRERAWAQLMLALYGADRQADALAAYRQLRTTLVEQLGVEPNAMVVELERAILTGGDALEIYRRARGNLPGGPGPAVAAVGVAVPRRPPVGVTPAQLPAGVGGFTGRGGDLARLDACLSRADAGAGPGAVVISAIAGTAGVGKTALAVQWAHRVRDAFPDGQLYVNLRGYAPAAPLRPLEALVGFLQALGVPAEQIPVDVERAAALYRTMLADRRVLVVLDNAGTAEQVRPLLPGGGGCLVLVTSRDRLGGLVARDGAARITLDVLNPDEATVLLARILGAEWVAAEPQAVRDMVAACAGLPLALRVAAANLAAQPTHTIARFVADLHRNRLAALRIEDDEDSAVRAAFDLSYQALHPAAQRLFRLLGLVPGPDVTVAAAAALIDAPPDDTAAMLDELARAHLITEHAAGRYTFHDLLREYAAARARTDEPAPDREAATRRLYDWYLATLDAAAHLLYPDITRLPVEVAAEAGFDDHPAALAWVDAERANLLAAIEHAAAHGPPEFAWRLADALRGYFWQGAHVPVWVRAATAARTAAAPGDPLGAGSAELNLGCAYRFGGGSLSKAAEHLGRALTHCRQSGWVEGEAAALTDLASAYWESGRLHEAADLTQQALAVNRRLDRLGAQANNLANLGGVYLDLGRLTDASEYYTDALALYQKAFSPSGEAAMAARFGELRHRQGRLDDAAAHLADALGMYHEIGNHRTGSEARRELGEVRRDAGRYTEARDCVLSAVRIARTGDCVAEAHCLNALGTIDVAEGRPADAVAHHRVALRLARSVESRLPEVEAMLGLAIVDQLTGRLDDAAAGLDRVLNLARECGYRIVEGRARTARADLALDLGEPDRAIIHARDALANHRATGYRLGQARTLLVLGHAEHQLGDRAAAQRCRREALELFTDIGAAEADQVRLLVAR